MGGDFEVGMVSSAAELQAVQRLRYDVYVEEMGRYRSVADHDNRLLREPEDDHSWVFFARDGDRIVGTTRLTWGGDGFSERQIHHYRIQPFLAEIAAERMIVGERGMVLPQYRGTGLYEALMAASEPLIADHDVRLVFGACEPHLLWAYIAMGQRPYADRNISSDEAGYLIPLVSFVGDIDDLRGVDCIERVVAGTGSVRNTMMIGPDDYSRDVRTALLELGDRELSIFDGLSDDEVERCLSHSNIIETAAGDRVLKKGGIARNMFVVLDGTLEVRDDERVVGVLTKGDAFGEMAFLLERPRAFDVYAATSGTRVLSLSDGALRKMIAGDAVVAAKLLHNLARMLCLRLVKTS